MVGRITSASLAARARTWWEQEPGLLERECAAMAALAPDLEWHPEGAGHWKGPVPPWPFDRAAPDGLDNLLAGRRLLVRVVYGHAFPVAPPSLWALDPEPELVHRLDHAWHVNGDGSLCLLRSPAAWSGREPAAELVAKAAGWFVEYLLFSGGQITTMTSTGIGADTSLDALISSAGANSGPESEKPAAS